MQQGRNNKSPILTGHKKLSQKQTQPKTSQAGFRVTLSRHKKPQQFANRRNSISQGDNPTTVKQGSHISMSNYRQILMNEPLPLKDKQQSQKKKLPIFATKKQTFKEFIRKIQMHNKNKLRSDFQPDHQPFEQSSLNLHNTDICINPNNRTSIHDQLSLKMIQKPPQNHQTSLHHYVENSRFHITSQEIVHKIAVNYKDKSKQFVIHQTPSRGMVGTRGYKRSKTEQEIKFQAGGRLHKDQASDDQDDRKKYSTDFSTFEVTNAKKPLSHVSLKLMQYKLSQVKHNPQPKLKAFGSTENPNCLKDKDLTKHKKLLQTKYSKIRVRFGSSLYNKNLWRNDAKSKQTLRKQLESICTEDLITIKYNKKSRKPSFNSIFCQHKILQAQNIFIQKRRLVPANVIEPRQAVNKTSKRFFSVTNSFKRHKTIENEGKGKKGEKLNGWDFVDDGVGDERLEEEFF